MAKSIFIKYWPLILLIFLYFLTAWSILKPGYFSHHDDLQVMRIFEMRKCILDYQIPCRWVPDMGYGNGFPLYNYYNVFPYYLGAIFSFFTSFIIAAKLLFLIPLALAGPFMYLLVKELWGKYAGLLAAILYMFAPYKALDLYVRGAVAESFAITLIPFVFYLSYKLIYQYSYKFLVLFSLFLSFFLTSHNIMTLFFLPVLFIWMFFWSFKFKKSIYPVIAGLLLGIGFSAFFTIPAFLEKNLVNIDTLRIEDLDFRAHFVTLKQLFLDRSWGYGASVPGPNDSISFQIGWPHWWIAISVGLFLILLVLKKSFKKSDLLIPLFFFILFLGSIFMTHNRSAFLWELSGTLQFAQFPWRFLSITIFSLSILGGFLVSIFKGKTKILIFLALSILTVILNWQFFIPEKFYSITDNEKLSGKLWEEQSKAAILDYLPKTALEPRESAPKDPLIISGEAKTTNFFKNTNSFKFNVLVKKDANIEIPIFDFPDWTLYVNDKKFNHNHNNYLGRISLDLPQGEYKVEGFFKNTPIRTFSNLITLASVMILIFIRFYERRIVR